MRPTRKHKRRRCEGRRVDQIANSIWIWCWSKLTRLKQRWAHDIGFYSLDREYGHLPKHIQELSPKFKPASHHCHYLCPTFPPSTHHNSCPEWCVYSLLWYSSVKLFSGVIDTSTLRTVLTTLFPLILERLGDKDRVQAKACESIALLGGYTFKAGSSAIAIARSREGKGPETPSMIFERLFKDLGLVNKVWKIREQVRYLSIHWGIILTFYSRFWF